MGICTGVGVAVSGTGWGPDRLRLLMVFIFEDGYRGGLLVLVRVSLSSLVLSRWISCNPSF